MLDISDRERQSEGRSELCGTPPSPSTHRSFTLTLHTRSPHALGVDSDRLTYQKSDDNPSFVFPWQAVLADLEEKLRELKDKKNTMRKRCRLNMWILRPGYEGFMEHGAVREKKVPSGWVLKGISDFEKLSYFDIKRVKK